MTVRTIKVRNASILANLGSRKIDFEIRTTKDSAQGFALYVDDKLWLEIDLVGSALKDTFRQCPDKISKENQPIFQIIDVKGNGCL